MMLMKMTKTILTTMMVMDGDGDEDCGDHGDVGGYVGDGDVGLWYINLS